MRLIGIVVLGLLAVASLSAGTGISGIKGGQKGFTLNNKVGPNGIIFISDAPMEKIQGTSDGLTGWYKLDPANLEGTTGELQVQVTTMKTAISKRDGHMYSSKWLDAEKYPTITFKIDKLTSVKVNTSDGKNTVKAVAVGHFTCHGVTKPMSANIEIVYLVENSETKKRASGDLNMINATFVVPLKNFNVEGSSGQIGKDVGEEIQITASIYANS